MNEICRGCDQQIEGEVGTLWVEGDFGLTALKVHKTQECGRAALAKTGYKMRKGNKPPESRKDRMKREVEGGR